jgi:hypothetical protein
LFVFFFWRHGGLLHSPKSPVLAHGEKKAATPPRRHEQNKKIFWRSWRPGGLLLFLSFTFTPPK